MNFVPPLLPSTYEHCGGEGSVRTRGVFIGRLGFISDTGRIRTLLDWLETETSSHYEYQVVSEAQALQALRSSDSPILLVLLHTADTDVALQKE